MTKTDAQHQTDAAPLGIDDARDYVAHRYYGSRRWPHRSTVYRWMRDGHPHPQTRELVRLQHMRIGRSVVTRRAWLDDFFAALSTAPTQHPNRTARRRSHAEAVQTLRAAGI